MELGIFVFTTIRRNDIRVVVVVDIFKTSMLDLKMNQAQQSGTALLYNATGQPVAISLPPRSTRYESYKNKESMIAGVILISAGILSIIFNAIGITLHEAVIMDGEGIWIGVMVSKLCFEFFFHACLNLYFCIIHCDPRVGYGCVLTPKI